MACGPQGFQSLKDARGFIGLKHFESFDMTGNHSSGN